MVVGAIVSIWYPPAGYAIMAVGAAATGIAAKKAADEAMKAAKSSNQGLQSTTETSQRMVPVVYGRQRLGGNVLYRNTYTENNGVPNGALDTVYGLCEGEIDAVEEVWFDDVLVWVNGNETDSIFRDYFAFAYQPGTADQPYFEWIRLADPDFEDCYRHTAVAWLHLDYAQEIYKTFPVVSFVVRGLKCYDPRTDAVVWTQTGPLQFRDLLTSVRYGCGVPATRVDDVAFGEEADYAETVVVRDSNLVVTGEKVSGGNGQNWPNESYRLSGSSYSGALAHRPVSPGTVTFQTNGGTITDDGSGNLSGAGGSGTINYSTGAYSLSFSVPFDDEHLRCSYRSGQKSFLFRVASPIVAPGTLVVTDGVETFTDNGAGVLTGSAGGTGTVDYDTGWVTAAFLVAPAVGSNVTASYSSSGSPRFSSNYFCLAGEPALDVLREFLDHFMAALLFSDGVYRVKIEKPEIVTKHFRSGGAEDANNNILDGSFTWAKAGIKSLPSGIRGKWTNPGNRYVVEDYVVPISSGSTQGEAIFNLPGITDLAVLERLLYTRRNLALLEISGEFKTNLSAQGVEPLDVIDVVHPDAAWDTARQLRVVATVDSLENEVIGLSFVEYDANAYVDQPNVVEVDHPPGGGSPSDVPPSVTGLTLTEFWRQLADSTWTSWLRVEFVAPENYPYVDAYEVYARSSSEGGDYKSVGETRSTTFEFGPVEERQLITVMVVVRAQGGARYVETGVIASIIPGGKSAPPSDVSFVDARCTFVNKVILEWNPIADTDLAYYEVRTDLSWGNAAGMVYKGLGTSFWMEPTQEVYTFYIKAVDTSGNFSVNYDSITLIHETPVPVFVSAEGGFQRVRIEWEPIADEAYGVVEVWRADTNNRGAAWKAGEIHSNVFVDTAVQVATTYYYWLRTRSVSGFFSVWDTGDTAGHSVTTAAINTADLADEAITKFKMAANLTPPEIVDSLPSLPDAAYPPNSLVVLSTTSKLYRNKAGAWTAEVAVDDLDRLIAGADIAVDSIVAKHLVVSDFSNLALNPNFDGGDASHWSYSADVSIIAKGTAGVPANAPMDYVCKQGPSTYMANPKALSITDRIACTPGDEFFIAAECASDSSVNGAFSVGVQWIDKDAGYISNVSAQQRSGVSAAWGKVGGIVVAPANARWFVFLAQNFGTAGYWYFTQARVRKAAGSELVVDGAISADKLAANSVVAGKIEAGAIGADEIAANAVIAKHLIVADFSNMVSDPLFSGNGSMDKWGGTATVVAKATAGVPSGAPTAYVMKLASAQNISETDLHDCAPGDAYYISFETASDGSVGAGEYILARIYWYTADEAYVGHDAVNSTVGQIAAWTKFSGIFVAPATARKCFFFLSRTTGTGYYYAAQPRIRKATDAALIVDGAVTADKIAANAITAVKVGANEIIAQTANLANLVVDTVKIADNAVTVPVSATGNGPTSLSAGDASQTEIISATITTHGQPIHIFFQVEHQSFTAGSDLHHHIWRDSTELTYYVDYHNFNYATSMYSLVDQPAAGTYTYRIKSNLHTGGTGGTVNRRNLILLETRK